jgi:3-dehydroquinate synthase
MPGADEGLSSVPWRQRVRLEFEYPVLFTRGAFATSNETLLRALVPSPGRRLRVSVIVDSGVSRAWPELATQIEAYFGAHSDELELAATPREVPGGEACKNDPEVITQLQAGFFADRLDRHCTVLIIGGGAVLDAVGYAAAVSHRGIRVVRVPTSVLAQNDAGIGVKNGVNAFGVKNALGTFAPPFAVVNDLDFIATLERRDKAAGMAEAVKVALIRDEAFFHWLESNVSGLAAHEDEAMAYMIRRCAELHLEHISQSGDPFEMGSARPLDFGHWAAHKLELLSHHELRHGEAVAIGIGLDSIYSSLIGTLAREDAARIIALLTGLGLVTWHDTLDKRDNEGGRELMRGLEEFREHLGGDLTITLLEGIGRGYETNAIESSKVERAIEELRGQRASAAE